MRDNKRILQEAFFKKESYSDKLKRKYPQYEPLDVKQTSAPGIGGIMANTDQGRVVTDMDAAKERLVSAFGASVGINTVKSMASRSIKSFPIIVSDNVDPETSVMLKRLMEEQYAEYINLLISNQVLDISSFRSGEDGNIAIQALDTLTGADFGKQKLAKKALSGELSADDFFQNFSAYNLIRQESKEYKTGMPLFDALLENAIISTPENAEKLTEYMTLFSEDFIEILETPNSRDEKSSNYIRFSDLMAREGILKSPEDLKRNFDTARGLISSAETHRNQIQQVRDSIKYTEDELRRLNALPTKTQDDTNQIATLTRDRAALTARLNTLSLSDPADTPDRFERLTSSDIIVKKDETKKAFDSSVGELLLDPKNEFLRDKFEKATFLLEARRISGMEWIEYLISRLGIPVREETRKKVLKKYNLANVITQEGSGFALSTKDQMRIATSRALRSQTLIPTLAQKGKNLLKSLAISAGIGTIAGGATFGVLALLGLAGPLIPIIAGAAIGGAVLTRRLIKRFRLKNRNSKIEGWERVEVLINQLEEQQRNIRKIQVQRNKEDEEEKKELNPQFLALSGDELKKELLDYSKEFEKIYKESSREDIKRNYNRDDINASLSLDPYFDKNIINEAIELGKKLEEELTNDNEYQELLLEALIGTKKPTTTTIPIKLQKQYEYDKKAKPEILVAPAFSSRSTFAYGSVEYDKRELKDRKYNAPLVMKVTFKERFSDGTFSDNDLVAVIGILGVITRVPSSEMKYILESNTEGKTLKGIFQSDGSTDNVVSDILGVAKIKKDIENLPQSGEVWQNLERVARLAVSNKLSGKKTNNIANAHLVFSQKEVDDVRSDTNIDYLKDKKLSADLMKRYSAFTLMIANDVSERLYIFDDPDSVSWNVVPYSAIRSKDTGDQLTSALAKMASQQR